jgi:SAM-dependent methyltransferase
MMECIVLEVRPVRRKRPRAESQNLLSQLDRNWRWGGEGARGTRGAGRWNVHGGGGIMLDQENRVREEFTRQVGPFSVSAAVTDAALTQRFVTALGVAAKGSVLDVACGPGILSAVIAKTAREVVAFDLTPQMLKKAAQRCAEAGLDNVKFREGNATELPFADAAFDALVTRLSVHHFDRPAGVIESCHLVIHRLRDESHAKGVDDLSDRIELGFRRPAE